MIYAYVEELKEIQHKEEELYSQYYYNITNLLKMHSEILYIRLSAMRIWLYLVKGTIVFQLILLWNI